MAEAVAGKGAAFLLALLSILLLSTNAVAVVVSAGAFDPFLFSLGATIVSLAAYSPALLAPEGRKTLRRLLPVRSFQIAIVFKAINDLAFYFVIIYTQQIEAAVIVYLYPIFNLLLGCLILSDAYRRPGPGEWLLIVLSFVSILLLTPIYGLADLSFWGFFTALLSAAASVYVVLLQAATDKAGLPKTQERTALGALFAGSLVLHIAAILLGLATGLWSWPESYAQSPKGLVQAPETVLWPILGMVWVGLVVGVLSESLWLRAARIYRMVSLKSLFYLSPVLTAVYFAVLDIDDLNWVIVFCLAGVVASNYLLHDSDIDEPSMIAFLFGLVGMAVFFKLIQADPIAPPIPMTQATYESFITFTVVILGFLLSRALTVAQDNAARYLDLANAALPALTARGATEQQIEEAMARLATSPDIFLWPEDQRCDPVGRRLGEVLGRSDVAPVYLAFLNKRLMGVTRPEVLLTSLLSMVAIGATVSQALQADRGYFLASFSTGILLFIPMLIREYNGLGAARQYSGVIVRRRLAMARMAQGSGVVQPASGRFLQAGRLRTLSFAVLAVIVSVCSWAMLAG